MFDSITVQTATEVESISILIFTIALSFVLSTLLAFVYQKTFRGLSYSRNYVQSIVLISIISAVVIQSVGDSLSRGIGIMAAMSIIRFRTHFKDPRDTLFLFAALAAGIACGSYAFPVAIIGTLGFSIAAIVLYYSPLGPNSYFDGMLRFNLQVNNSQQKELERLLQEFCKSFALVTMREMAQGERLDYAYHIKLRKAKRHEDFMAELKRIDDLQGLSLMMQESTVDI
ncbi:DUF4956 domain-containing protein [Methyloprofundus sp.]|uniref:DUF4956 domain-containing protein n=1 Tax=Methyloprofundus sp. TaxID=2020875 RepID=UPI003D0E0BB1